MILRKVFSLFRDYYPRLIAAYVFRRRSHLSFWHDTPSINPDATFNALGPYYMVFGAKADYPGPFDAEGVPILQYHGSVGRQYNPIAIAQYGLGNYNQYCRSKDADRLRRFLQAANWLVLHLERNALGLSVWNHYFDWHYRVPLKSPWYSGLAQGQGLSVLVRAYKETGEEKYASAVQDAFRSFEKPLKEGGVVCQDLSGDVWIEEYIVDPPTHILNGFIWAIWGIWDYWLGTREMYAQELFNETISTLERNLERYDTGFWSLYERPERGDRMLASFFYHRLHIIQLDVLFQMTGRKVFGEYSERWREYERNFLNRMRAGVLKAFFKITRY